jgi:hypothetical protein
MIISSNLIINSINILLLFISIILVLIKFARTYSHSSSPPGSSPPGSSPPGSSPPGSSPPGSSPPGSSPPGSSPPGPPISDLESKCIQGITSNVCFSPYEHILGSDALQLALEKEKASGSDAGKQIAELEKNGSTVMFGLGSAGVANNAEWTKNENGEEYWNNGWTSNNNGSCYQIRYEPNNIEGKHVDVIMQSINTGLPNAFDVYLPLGGAGAFDQSSTCSYVWGSDNKVNWSAHIQDTEVCTMTSEDPRRRKKSNSVSYKGEETLENWKLCESKNPDDFYPKQTAEQACNNYFNDKINPIFGGDSKKSFINSCIKSVETRVACPFNGGVVEHPGSVWRRVECPKELTEVSGLRIKEYAGKLGDKPKRQQIDTDPKNTTKGFYSIDDWSAEGDNAFGIKKEDIDMNADITQMQDCRSPDSSQCFKLPKGTKLDKGREAAFNVNTDGSIITESGWRGCHNLPYVGKVNTDPDSPYYRTPGNWTNLIQNSVYTDKQPYKKGLCPIAFPPGQDSCVMYQNTNICSGMKYESDGNNCLPEKLEGQDISNLRLNDKKCWSDTGGEPISCGDKGLAEYTDDCLNNSKDCCPGLKCMDFKTWSQCQRTSNLFDSQPSCGKVTVKKTKDYKADATTGITEPDSINNCEISYDPDAFDVNGDVWNKCNADIRTN